jgi:hypothetical protein
MSSQLTHERCSELLGDYLARELAPEQHRLVENRLEHCAQCSAERAGLAALRSDAEPAGLTGDERVQLRAAVLDEIRDPSGSSSIGDESDAVVVPLGGRDSRAGKYLGIAAVLALLAVGSMFIFGGGGLGVIGGDSDSMVGSAEDSGDSGGAGGAEEDSALSEEEGGEAFRFNADDFRPNVQPDRGAISEGDLDRLGKRVLLAYSLSETAATSDNAREESERDDPLLSDQAPDRSLDRLATRAPEPLAPELVQCGQTALDELGGPGLATYATTATIEGEDAIIIGFVTGGRTLDRYAIFAFPRGDCTTILASTEGPRE